MYQGSLTEEERQRIYARFPYPRKVHCAAVAKLYISYPSNVAKWEETGFVGAWIIYSNEERKTLHLQLIDIETGTRFFTQELYEEFQYIHSTPYFHAFESDDCVIGVSFALEYEATRFHGCVGDLVERKEYRLRPNAIRKAWSRLVGFPSQKRMASKSKATTKGKSNNSKGTVASISGPTNFRHDGHMGLNRQGQFELIAPTEWLSNNAEWGAFYKNELHLSDEELKDPALIKRMIEATAQFIFEAKNQPNRPTPPPIPPRPTSPGTMRRERHSRELPKRPDYPATPAPDQPEGVAPDQTPTWTHQGMQEEHAEPHAVDVYDSEGEAGRGQQGQATLTPPLPPLPPTSPCDPMLVAQPVMPQPGQLQADQKQKLLDRLKHIRERVQDSDSEEEEEDEEAMVDEDAEGQLDEFGEYIW